MPVTSNREILDQLWSKIGDCPVVVAGSTRNTADANQAPRMSPDHKPEDSNENQQP